jgi:hypothetical protein
MRRSAFQLIGLAIFLIAAEPANASRPTIEGEISGVELCPEAVCGAAIFTGTFQGEVGNDSTPGFFWASVQHETLPLDPKQPPAAVLGGKWSLSTLRGQFSGSVIDGVITNNGGNTFTVQLTLQLKRGGRGRLLADVLLDHNEFPPIAEGELFQPE